MKESSVAECLPDILQIDSEIGTLRRRVALLVGIKKLIQREQQGAADAQGILAYRKEKISQFSPA